MGLENFYGVVRFIYSFEIRVSAQVLRASACAFLCSFECHLSSGVARGWHTGHMPLPPPPLLQNFLLACGLPSPPLLLLPLLVLDQAGAPPPEKVFWLRHCTLGNLFCTGLGSILPYAAGHKMVFCSTEGQLASVWHSETDRGKMFHNNCISPTAGDNQHHRSFFLRQVSIELWFSSGEPLSCIFKWNDNQLNVAGDHVAF